LINSDRRIGNDWNSTIEFIYEYNKKPYLCLYVQSSSTDSSTCVSFKEFTAGSTYNGYCRNLGKRFTYDAKDIANTIRCILKEFVYYKYIEKEEREKQEAIKNIMPIKMENTIADHFYHALRLDNLPFSMATMDKKYDWYCNGKKAIKKHVEDNYKELAKKSYDEVKSTLMEVFKSECHGWC
jgi:hypothetical protein